MIIARVVGSAVSTIKDSKLTGQKLLIVQRCDQSGAPNGDPFIAVDTVGAGESELVFLAEGSAARYTDKTIDAPTDATIIGVLDSLQVNTEVTFRKS